MKTSTDVRTHRAPLEPDADLAASATFAPVRLLAGGGNAFEQRLLESACADRISSASRAQLARALKVPTAPLPVVLLQRLLRPLRLAKPLTFTGLGALVLLGAWAARPEPHPAPAAPTRPLEVFTAPSTAPSGAAAPAPAASEGAAAGLLLAHDALLPPPRLEAADPASKPRSRVHSAPPPRRALPPRAASEADRVGARDGLGEELRALEAIQRLVRSGRSREASSALDDYARRFPEGELGLEADLLGLDVSLARGDRKHTRERARELLARPEAASYRERLEALWSAAGGNHDATRRGSDPTALPHRRAEVTQ
jgi:hypothetical protein